MGADSYFEEGDVYIEKIPSVALVTKLEMKRERVLYTHDGDDGHLWQCQIRMMMKNRSGDACQNGLDL